MIGTKVGQFTITQEIGDGGHAFVFRGKGDDGSDVAIKMLKPSVADEDNLEKRFVLEAEALKELNHPYIVGFHNYIFLNGYHYLVLEYMDQGSVEDLLDNMGPIPHRYAIPIFFKVLQAMQFSHEHKYIHRDMKPNNILINTGGEAKLSDFGIAKVVGGGQGYTKQGFVLGTTLYMAPEFISRGEVTVQTDIYALGVTFYEMLTNRKPFEFERDDEPLVNFVRRVCRGTPTRPTTYVDLPAPLERIVMKAIAQNPKERYRTAGEFAKDLEKTFPELVNRPIVIPRGTKRAMTNYVDMAAEGIQDLDLRPPSETSGGLGAGARAAIAVVVALIVGGLGFAAPRFLGDALGDTPEVTVQVIGAVLGLVLGAVAFFLLPKGKASDTYRPAAAAGAPPKKAPNRTEDSEDGILSSSELDDFSVSAEPAEEEPSVEDTIPFQNPSTKKMQPFKMTDASELKGYLQVTGGADKGRRFGLRPISRIGRDLRLDIRPHDQEISRHHAVLAFDGTGFTVEDLGSTNGTWVNERRITNRVRLVPGDTVRVGSTVMRFEYGD
ncbi:MAG: FHA domain-containing serine/threonine-protein kinase [Planctomycetota bacterium]